MTRHILGQLFWGKSYNQLTEVCSFLECYFVDIKPSYCLITSMSFRDVVYWAQDDVDDVGVGVVVGSRTINFEPKNSHIFCAFQFEKKQLWRQLHNLLSSCFCRCCNWLLLLRLRRFKRRRRRWWVQTLTFEVTKMTTTSCFGCEIEHAFLRERERRH